MIWPYLIDHFTTAAGPQVAAQLPEFDIHPKLMVHISAKVIHDFVSS